MRIARSVVAIVALLVTAACHDRPTEYRGAYSQLTVVVDGLPAGVDADVRITGPSGYARTIGTTQVLTDLAPGRYQIRANDVRVSGFTWSATPSTLSADFGSGDTAFVGIAYAVATGAIRVLMSGLPSGATGSVRIAGPGGLTRTAAGSVTFGDLPPGDYTISVDSVNTGGTAWRGTSPATIRVAASLQPVPVPVTYSNVTGTLVFVTTGLPGDVTPAARVQGPLLTDTLVHSGTALRVPVGSYVVTPLPATRTSTTPLQHFEPAVRTVSRTISDASATVPDTVAVPYLADTAPVNITLDNVIITQAVQRSDNGIPLVSGREALLRAFVVADREGVQPPRAIVRLYEGNMQIGTLFLDPPAGTLPLTTREDRDSASYSVRLAADLVRSSLRVQVEVDPDSSAGEVQRADNIWPGGSAPGGNATRALNTTTVPTFTVRFVPVVLGGDTGIVTDETRAALLKTARAMWPIATIESDVRAPFVSAVAELQPNDANGGWTALLNELRALRVADGAPATMHYYGVVHTPYDSGFFGLGLIGSPTAVGWDRGDAATVATHEWGHNFGRTHTPCGDPPGPDAQYPVLGGFTGSTGWDVRTSRLMPPTSPDIMGYCANPWVSEYSYSRALTFRQASGAGRITQAGRSADAQPRDALLVWGRSEGGRLMLEAPRILRGHSSPPSDAFTSHAAESGAPTHRVELIDAQGRVLLTTSLRADPVDHHPAVRLFATAVPLVAETTTLRVTDLAQPHIVSERAVP